MASSSERLLCRPWATIDIDKTRFLCKSLFGLGQYHVLFLDSETLWEEQVEAEEIQSRAKELNRRLCAAPDSLFSQLVAMVTPLLTGGGSDHVTLQRSEGHLTLRLKSELAGLPFYWEFHCRPTPVATACEQLVHPLLAMSGTLQRQTQLLSRLLRRKDEEIQDYSENGAQLTRERLRTEPFVEDSFRENFMMEMFPRLMEEQEDFLKLDFDLQTLYSSVVYRQNNNNKRKRQEPEEKDTTEDQQRENQTEAIEDSLPEDNQATLPTMHQVAPSVPVAAERAASKPKKKKTGLFR